MQAGGDTAMSVGVMLMTHEAVSLAAVIGVPHPDFGEGVTAVVSLRTGSSLDERQILTALRDRLAGYKLPKRILFTEDLPRNAMGKVQKNQLRERYEDLFRDRETKG